jgi:hypothetical protein
MTAQPPTVTRETAMLEAARLLHDRRIGGRPVVEGGAVDGSKPCTCGLQEAPTVQITEMA